MKATLDVFRIDSNGDGLWRCTCEDMEAATRYVREMSANDGSAYMIMNMATREKVHVPAVAAEPPSGLVLSINGK